MNFAFYISSKATRLNNIIREKKGILNDTKVVISDSEENLYIKRELELLNIKFEYFKYKQLNKENDRNLMLSNFLMEKFDENNIDYIFVFGNHILKGDLLSKYKNRLINFHPSFLPSFKGINAIDQAIQTNAIIIGNTAHFINETLDGGPIIMQNAIFTQVFLKEGYDAILNEQIPMLEMIWKLLKENRISVENDKVKINGAIYDEVKYFPNVYV